MKNPVKSIRRVVQMVFLALFLWLLWQARWPGVDQRAPAHTMVGMDPLAALVSWISPSQFSIAHFQAALVVIVLTMLLGRVFCGWICPLGTTIDIFDHIFLRKRTKRANHLNRPAWKYYVLGAVLVAALFGTQIAWLLDPIPLFTRTCSIVLYPIIVGVYNFSVVKGWDALQAAGLELYPTDVAPGYSLGIAVMLVFATVLGLSLLSRRYWCRTLCPLGALLGFLGRFGLLNRKVQGCVSCARCEGACKMGAIPGPDGDTQDFSRTYSSECIQCYDCLVCPSPGISSVSFRVFHRELDAETHASRRHFLAAMGLGVVYAASASAGVSRRVMDERLIRPPGAIVRGPDGSLRTMGEAEFRDLCLRCGACMRACPTNGLQPAVAEAGFDGLFTPILVPRIGYCEQGCTTCGDVCPSGALVRFDVEEKTEIVIGTATVNQNKCLCWRPGDMYRLCLVCDEHCPYDAIQVIENHDGERAPFVDPDVCVGCGLCENACPLEPEAAIVVHQSGLGL